MYEYTYHQKILYLETSMEVIHVHTEEGGHTQMAAAYISALTG